MDLLGNFHTGSILRVERKKERPIGDEWMCATETSRIAVDSACRAASSYSPRGVGDLLGQTTGTCPCMYVMCAGIWCIMSFCVLNWPPSSVGCGDEFARVCKCKTLAKTGHRQASLKF